MAIGGARALWEPIRSLAFGSISGTYTAIGTATNNPAVMVAITNNTDALLTFSFDTTNDIIVIPSTTARIWDIGSNTIDDFAVPAKTTFYVKGSPTVGSIYVEITYAA